MHLSNFGTVIFVLATWSLVVVAETKGQAVKPTGDMPDGYKKLLPSASDTDALKPGRNPVMVAP